MDVETEIADIKRRLTALENEVKADRQLSVRMFSYVREIRDDVALLRSHAVVTDQRIEHFEQRMDSVDRRLDRLENDLAALRSEFNTFRKELPGIVADAMREVLRDMRAR